jgi:FPC/CPF motif-containing protein YcgG
MKMDDDHIAVTEYVEFINNKKFPCIGAKAAMAQNPVQCLVVGNMACPADDNKILSFLYNYIDSYRAAGGIFHSAAIIFTGPENISEAIFEKMLWQRLQAISNLDSLNYRYDKRVSSDINSPDFSFSLKEEAFFIIGLHPGSSRAARRFKYPALVFNPHEQFQIMKETNRYERMKKSVRKRDIALSGSVNPMLNDHGKKTETLQYSGKNYTSPLQCPLKINHATS